MTGRHGYIRIFLLAGCVWISGATLADPTADSAPGTHVWVGDHRLHIHCVGEGSPTVVFDSGLGGTSLDWSRVHPEVAEFTRACVYDRAGYGWSEAGPWPRNSATIVAELEKLLSYSSVAPPYVLVGHSFGGLNVRLFANEHPERTAGLVLVDSSHEDQFTRFEEAGISSLAPRGGTFVVRNQQQIPDGLPAELRPLAQAFAMSNDSVVSLHAELRYFRASARQVKAASTLPDVPLIVVTHGSPDSGDSPQQQRMALLWMSMQEELARRSPHGTLVVAQTSEHYIQLYEPEVVIDAIHTVVDESRSLRTAARAATPVHAYLSN